MGDAFHQIEHLLLINIQFRMIRSQIIRHLFGILGLIILFFMKTNGKSFHRLPGMLLGYRRYQRRIIPTAQKSPQRHIGYHPVSSSFFQQPFQFLFGLSIIPYRIFLLPMINILNFPIFPDCYFPCGRRKLRILCSFAVRTCKFTRLATRFPVR